MATITMNIPDDVLPDLLDALSIPYGWVQGGGQTKAQFARDTLRTQLRTQVSNWRVEQARVAAAHTEAVAVDTATSGISVT